MKLFVCLLLHIVNLSTSFVKDDINQVYFFLIQSIIQIKIFSNKSGCIIEILIFNSRQFFYIFFLHILFSLTLKQDATGHQNQHGENLCFFWLPMPNMNEQFVIVVKNFFVMNKEWLVNKTKNMNESQM